MAEKSAKERSDKMLKNIAGQVLRAEMEALVTKHPKPCKRWAEQGNPEMFLEFVLDVWELANGQKLCPFLPDMLMSADDDAKEHLFDLFKHIAENKELCKTESPKKAEIKEPVTEPEKNDEESVEAKSE